MLFGPGALHGWCPVFKEPAGLLEITLFQNRMSGHGSVFMFLSGRNLNSPNSFLKKINTTNISSTKVEDMCDIFVHRSAFNYMDKQRKVHIELFCKLLHITKV